MIRYIDCHTHVHFAAYVDDYREVVDRAFKAGVAMINVGTQRDTSKRAIEVAYEFPNSAWATVGLHPIHTEESYHDVKEIGAAPQTRGEPRLDFKSRREEFDYDYYKKLAEDPKVVAIGECGLDYYRLGEETKEKQKKVFEEHIRLAREMGKPLMIHCRQAFSDLIQILAISKLPSPPGVIHFFSGTKEDAKKLLELGFSFTFGGVITFVRDYDAVIQMIPMERILSETDAPYVSPAPYRGKRNEPAYVVEAVKRLAELKEVSIEKMAEQIWENAKRIFALS